MLKFYQHLDSLCSIVLFCCLLVLIGCSSHTTPYYFPPLPDEQENDVKELPAAIKYRIILIGDAGAPKTDEPVLETLGEWAEKLPKKTSIVFLGDNMYDNGLTEEAQKKGEADKRLGPQLDVVIASQAYGLFIPGNHDWDKGGKHGHSAVMAQEDFINKRLSTQSQRGHPAFLPEHGKPGPSMLELPTAAPAVRLVVLDTQWWLHEESQKPPVNPKVVIECLKTQLRTDLPVIVVGHHPIETYGPHGGYGDWKPNLFGYLKWKLLRRDQDTSGGNYKDMVNRLRQVLSVRGPGGTPLLIYAAGHDHSLQVLRGRTTDYLLVSGAGSKLSGVTHGDNTLFAHEYPGFMVVDFLENDAVLLRVVEPNAKEVHFHQWLKW